MLAFVVIFFLKFSRWLNCFVLIDDIDVLMCPKSFMFDCVEDIMKLELLPKPIFDVDSLKYSLMLSADKSVEKCGLYQIICFGDFFTFVIVKDLSRYELFCSYCSLNPLPRYIEVEPFRDW